MASMEATSSIFSLLSLPLSPPPSSSSSSSILLCTKPYHCISISTLSLSRKLPFYPSPFRPRFELQSAVEEQVSVQESENGNKSGEGRNIKKKLYVVNLAWSLSADDLKSAFSESGTVEDVEIIRDKDGRNRGYAFITMASGEEAQAVVDKFHSKELSGRTIRVEYAKQLKKPRPPRPPAAATGGETKHVLYVSNLQWKVRSSHLREFFAANFGPVSARVVFDSPSGRSAGYGFVSFTTREEAENAISTLNGKELMGRPILLRFSEKKGEDESGGAKEADIPQGSGDELGDELLDGQPEQS